MGLGFHMVEALIREHLHRPIKGDVVLVGRQTVYFSPEHILGLMREHGVDVSSWTPEQLELDKTTVDRHGSFKADDPLISDRQLFNLLSDANILALDHSDYEGAEIVHDLTKPVPDKLRGCADVIVDGSTLDNVFDPAMTVSNFAEMLRPGGRLITTNMLSNHHEPYSILPPLWYLDYFVMNGFADCKVYILVYGPDNDTNVFTVDLDALIHHPDRQVSSFRSNYTMATIVLAEKGADSTSDVRPSQQHYRSDADWATYKKNLARIKDNPRSHLARSASQISFDDIVGGHLFLDNNFVARDPMTEIVARENRKIEAVEVPPPMARSSLFGSRIMRTVKRLGIGGS